jgi:hypothetical protein
MTKLRFPVVAFLLLAGFFLTRGDVSGASLPNGVHYKSGPTCSQSSSSDSCLGDIVGLGSATVTGNLAVGIDTVIGCTNNGGQFVSVKTHSVDTTTGSFTSSGNNLSFNLLTPLSSPTFSNAKAAGCPNNNWHYSIESNSFTGFTLFWCFGKTLISSLTYSVGPNAPAASC